MDVRIKGREKRRSHMVAPRIKRWHLEGENKEFSDTRTWKEGLDNHKEMQMICGIRWKKRLEKWLK